MRTPEEFLAALVTAYEAAPRDSDQVCTRVLIDYGTRAVVDLIRERDAEVRADTLSGFTREDIGPFFGHGHTTPGYWRLVGPKHYKQLPADPSAAAIQALRERFGVTRDIESP